MLYVEVVTNVGVMLHASILHGGHAGSDTHIVTNEC